MTIDHAMEIVPELKEAYKKEKDTKEIIDLAKKLEGCVRHISVHAAGVVIAPKPLYEYMPTQFDPKGGKIITQYDMYSVEEAGLLKFDFLGIRNLAILADAISLVKKFYDINIDIERIPLDDKKTFALLANGQTEGLIPIKWFRYDQIFERIETDFHSRHQCHGRALSSRPNGINSGIYQTQTQSETGKIFRSANEKILGRILRIDCLSRRFAFLRH